MPALPRRTGTSWKSWTPYLIAAALQLGLLWGTTIPLGVPGEWEWPRIAASSETLFSLVLLVPVAAVYIVYVQRGFQLFQLLTVKARRWWLAGLYFLGVTWTWVVLGSLPGITGLPRLPLVLYFHGTSGYYTQAKQDIGENRKIGEFLRTYPERIADSTKSDNHLHLGTHPPGLTVALQLLQSAVESSKTLQYVGRITQPQEVQEVLTAVAASDPDSLRDVDAACLWLASGLTLLLSIGTLIPLYLLVRLTSSPRVAWLIAALWPLVPAVAIFLPKSDLVFPLLAVTAQVSWLASLQGKWRRGAVLAGLLLGFGMWFSLAMVPVGAILFLQAVATWFVPERKLAVVPTLIQAAAGFALPLLLAGLAGANLPYIWYLNYHNHAAFYANYTRTPAMWLWVNPLELVIALGAPVACWGVWNFLNSSRHHRLRELLSQQGAVVLIWGLLWLTGKNMGEAARLWCFLFPLALWLSAPQEPEDSDRLFNWSPWILLTLQILTSFGTVARIKGLDLGL